MKYSESLKLSVVMPCYNKPSYLIEMIKTIQVQTLKNWELILVDDGSDECNFRQVRDFIENDDRIKLVKRDRLPKNGDTCRNIGMDMATGEYIIIFDSDDLVSNTCFEQRVKFMEENPDCDYATFPSCSFVDGTKEYKPRKYDPSINNVLDYILNADYPFTVWGNIYRRSAVDKIRWDEEVYIYQDFDFMVQCELMELKHRWSEAEYKNPDYFYRVFRNGNSVCAKVVSEQKVVSSNYLFLKIARQINERHNGDFLMEKFFRFVLLHFEQMLLDYKKEYVDSFLLIVKQIFPLQYDKMRKIAMIADKHKLTHFNLFRLYFSLYLSYKEPLHRTYMIHELAKCILMSK